MSITIRIAGTALRLFQPTASELKNSQTGRVCHARILLLAGRQDGGALTLVRNKPDFQIQFQSGHVFINEYPNKTPEPEGFEDLAFVLYDDQIAVYVDGAKTMNFVKTPDMDGFFTDYAHVLPWLGTYDNNKKAQSRFKDVRLMVLD